MQKFARFIAGLRHLPLMVRQFSALADATERQDWRGVVDIIELLHSKGLSSNDTHYRLGCAYAMLGHWSVANREFEKIEGRLPGQVDEARRYFNHAYSLTMLERKEEALGILASCPLQRWPQPLSRKAGQLTEHLHDESASLPRIH